ncbi:MAG: accessory Sec system glycosyltransferase GtfA [Lactobacillus crispatus]|jgi:accessory Sec system glycosylation protein GtfA|nr:accessory Sec system glycosyltransferase GtfA [Lactobacillus crispatus]
MTVYNVNLGIGWASSGVEYAQKYRADAFKKAHIPAKFIFSDLILGNNIEDLTSNLGFTDDQIIWLYNFFTDIKIAPSTYSLNQLEHDSQLTSKKIDSKQIVDKNVVYLLNDKKISIVARLRDKDKQSIDQVTYLCNQKIFRRDFYSYTKYASEFYLDADDNKVFMRKFYNENGSVSYIQHLAGDQELFEFPNKNLFYSKNELYCKMIERLHLTENDYVILDRSDEDKNLINGQIIFERHGAAKLLVVVHAEHYDINYTNKDNILWNNFYEYAFDNNKEVAAFIVSTPGQRILLKQQLKHYFQADARVDAIPVGSLKSLQPTHNFKRNTLITASRLAPEKHLDWVIMAAILSHKHISDLKLDIYGEGGEKDKLQALISKNKADSYIRLMGQHDLTKVYSRYAAYISGSTSEGFGLSLMEAVGSGLPMIGFDVPYGNPTFIDNAKNGYLIDFNSDWDETKKCEKLSAAIIKLFLNSNLDAFRAHSYQVAENYLLDQVAQDWVKEFRELQND